MRTLFRGHSVSVLDVITSLKVVLIIMTSIASRRNLGMFIEPILKRRLVFRRLKIFFK